jgi:DNA polymerase (family X)
MNAPEIQTDKPRFPNALGMAVAAELCRALTPACERIIVAGSLRRRKPTIGDVEILYIPKLVRKQDPADMFSTMESNLADEVIALLEKNGVLERRKNTLGREMFGPKNKLMRHVSSGIPVDLFSATEENFWNYLVCRTGPAESNIRIAEAAKRRGYKWNPYGSGFTRADETFPMHSEEEVFQFVGMPFLKPEERK